jgi:hypothetical protein
VLTRSLLLSGEYANMLRNRSPEKSEFLENWRS